MSIRGLYSGSKSRYVCEVCLYDTPEGRASKQAVMESHIRSSHPRTVVAWLFKDAIQPQEELQEQAEDDQVGPQDETAPPEDPPQYLPEALPSLSCKKLLDWNMGSIDCISHEDAIKKIESMSGLPKQHFIKCFFPCMVEGCISVAVEQYNRKFSYPTEGHRQSAIRHIINTGIQLELDAIVHGNLKKANLVDVDCVPKYCGVPEELKSYSDFRAKIEIQCRQICESVDLIVGNGITDEKYQVFRKRLLCSENIVDLHSMLYSPYLAPKRQEPVFFGSCRLLLCFAKMDRRVFNSTVEGLLKEMRGNAASSSQDQKTWLQNLNDSKNPNLIHMLDTRIWEGKAYEYDSTPASNHEFVYNSNRHINDGQIKIHTLEDMHRDLGAVFPKYPAEIWEYMHFCGLNAYFGPEEYAYGLVNLVKKLTRRSDEKNFYFSPLLQALKMCCSMLVKFQNCHEKQFPRNAPFTKELAVATSEIDYCIRGLQSSDKELHNCLLIRIKAYELKDVDILVFKSVRIIIFALHFLKKLSDVTISTRDCMAQAIEITMNILSELSKTDLKMQIPSPRLQAMRSTNKWPPIHDVRKIAGVNFLISRIARSSFSGEIDELIGILVKMLIE